MARPRHTKLVDRTVHQRTHSLFQLVISAATGRPARGVSATYLPPPFLGLSFSIRYTAKTVIMAAAE
eukprot:IDg5799t1